MIETGGIVQKGEAGWSDLGHEIRSGSKIIHRVMLNSAKPGRPLLKDRVAWVAHSTAEYAQANLETPQESVAEQLHEAFVRTLCENDLECQVRSVDVHRWRYAFTGTPASRTHEALASTELPIYLCGDWVHESWLEWGVQGALLSGMAAAGRLLGRPGPVREEAPGGLFEGVSP
jgi:predicted NAD/FAD-dependent oxidoreductase